MKGNEFFAQLSTRPPFTKLHPKMASFFQEYLSKEKIVSFGDQWVVNTHFPPYPSRAFDRFADQAVTIGTEGIVILHHLLLFRCRVVIGLVDGHQFSQLRRHPIQFRSVEFRNRIGPLLKTSAE